MLFFSVLITGAAITGYTQVNQGELEGNLAPVEFVNYGGPHARIETREQIRQIGVPLGQTVRGGTAGGGRVLGASNRYFVIHSVSAPDGGRLDADIFGLGANAGVDHIRNLRIIIQGYLQEAYGYSAADALLLAEYITIYNAVYRANWNYFSQRYKQPVLGHLTREKAGISLRYNEWPGNTLMLIPLGSGGISSIDTSAISDSLVVEEMRKEDDRGVEQRRDMVDLKEREAAEAEQKAAEQREAIAAEEQTIAEERAQVAEEQQQIAEERQQLEEEKAAGEVTPQEAAEREEELARREAETEQKTEELDQREEELVLQREEAAQQEEFAEQKAEEARQDRESIAQDQQAIIERGDQGAQSKGLIGIAIEGQGAAIGRLVSIDPNTREILRRSPMNTVAVRTLTVINGKVLAIAGENTGNGAIRLVEIDTATLEMLRQGEDDIHPNSLIWVNGSDLYAITANPGGIYNLGRFNADLSLQAKSAVAVHPSAAVSIQQGGLLTQRSDGTAVILNPADLTER